MQNRTAWTSTVWGSGGANAERLVLPKGEENCHICMEAQVEVAMKPCAHEICLECCNRLRAANIFKVDAGIRCPLCRDYVEMFTDLNGNASSVPSLRAANDAASKSLATRRSGADATVSTSVPDPTRLVPSGAAARHEPQWVCDKCQHINTGNKEACVRCRCTNPGYTRPPPPTALDALKCPPDSVVPLLCEKGHASLKRALTEAGTRLVNGAIGGSAGQIRDALAHRGHERLCRIVALLVEGRADRLVAAARDTMGNYGIQRVMEAAAKLRAQAFLAGREGGPRPVEDFASSQPSGAAPTVTAATAYPRLVAAITSRAAALAADQFGVHVVLRAALLSPPAEVLALARQMAVLLPDLAPSGITSKEASIFISNVISRVVNLCFEGGATAPAAADVLNALLAAYRHNKRILIAHARHQYLGQALADAVSGALPRGDAFRACHVLACNAPWVSSQRNGTHTLNAIVSLESDDPVGRRMVRDLAAATAMALRGQLADVAASVGTDGPQLVQTILEVLARDREDAWIGAIAAELAAAAPRLAQQDASLEALLAALARPELDEDAVEGLMDGMEGAGVDMAAIRGEVRARRATAPPPPGAFFVERSEVQPDTDIEYSRRRLPNYVWELCQREQGGRSSTANGGGAQYGRHAGYAGAGEANGGFGAEVPAPMSLPSTESWQSETSGFTSATVLPHERPGYAQTAPQQQQQVYGYQPPYYAQQQQQQQQQVAPPPPPPPGFAQSPPAYAGPLYGYQPPQQPAYNPVAQQAHQRRGQEPSADLDPSAFFPAGAPAPATPAPYGQSPGSANGGYSDINDMIQRLTTGDGPSAATPPPGFSLPVNQPAAQTSVRPHVLMRFSTDASAANSAAPGSPQWAPPTAASAAVSSPPRPVQYVSASTTPAVPPLGVGGGSSAPVSPLPAAAAPAPAPVVSSHSHWTCPACTYLHVGKEAEYLVCAVCETQRPQADVTGPF